MHIPPGDRFTKRRHFHGVGRYPGVLPHVAAELNPERTNCLLLSDAPPEAALDPALETLRQRLGKEKRDAARIGHVTDSSCVPFAPWDYP